MEPKRRRVEVENRQFLQEWTDLYCFTLDRAVAVPMCLICQQTVALIKSSNVKRHYETKHKLFAKDFPLGSNQRKDKIASLLSCYTSSTKIIGKSMTEHEECGIEAKNQWKRLRDSHREAMRRRKTATSIQAPSIGPWKYEKQMEFVLPQNRDIYANFCTESSEATLTKFEDSDNSDIPNLEVERDMRRQLKEKEREAMRRQFYDENRTPRDALSDLFSSMYQKTRDLPKHLQLRVQREIFESVTRAEEEALSYENQDSSYYNSDSKYGQMGMFEMTETKFATNSPSSSASIIGTEEQDETK